MLVDHTPSSDEQAAITELLDEFQFEFVGVRLTRTMLSKAIIDARAPLQALLSRAGIVEYSAIGQGKQHKVQLALPLITSEGIDERVVSYYRPMTKKGDPRVWVSGLANIANPGDLLLFTFSDGQPAALLAKGSARKLVSAASQVLVRREGQFAWEAVVSRITSAIAPLRGRWIKTLRAGPTGVGYTASRRRTPQSRW
jgi:hypothetical protein